MDKLETLRKIRSRGITSASCGLSDDVVSRFLDLSQDLGTAIEMAEQRLVEIENDSPELLKKGEQEAIKLLQEGILNFYPDHSVTPFVPLGAKGPWIVTLSGAVLYDTGGYGMLGHGHNPDFISQVLAKPYVQANVMTPSFYQKKFIDKVRSMIGMTRDGGKCPYSKFILMNSGSEANAVAARICDAHAKIMTDPDGPHAGQKIMSISFRGSFHGRTTRPARVSDSTRKKYMSLASFRDLDNLLPIDPNDTRALERTFEDARNRGIYIEAMYLEPVMGEGNPGLGLDPEFYARARELCSANNTFLIIDSIQAGLRAQGVLSIVDYPGFSGLEAPDMESFSKALNGGQYPLSLLALREHAAKSYVIGTYGNTMTANPRGMEVGFAVLHHMTDGLSHNIRERGKEFVQKLTDLGQRLGSGIITKVQGVGLLCSAELRADIPVMGFGGVEEKLRKRGINVIHGGANSLRFTPFFGITSAEIDLMIELIEHSLKEFQK